MYKYCAILIFLLGFFLRFNRLSERPVWIDETKVATIVDDYYNYGYFEGIKKWNAREIVHTSVVYFTGSVNEVNEFNLRWLIALSGSLTILFLYVVIEDKKRALLIIFLIAVSPYFVFWSRMARPYALAGMFIVLGWRWPVFYIMGVLTNPLAIAGINFYKPKRYIFYILLFIGSTLYYNSLSLSSLEHYRNMDFLIHAKRIHYLFYLSLFIHVANYEQLQGLCSNFVQLAKQASSRLRNK